LHNIIVAGNTATTGYDLHNDGIITNSFHNLFGAAPTGNAPANAGDNIINSAPLLGPLQDNGGSTQTMALLTGSPASTPATAPWSPEASPPTSAAPASTDSTARPWTSAPSRRASATSSTTEPRTRSAWMRSNGSGSSDG
jgi:hypothetical protein